MISQLPERQVIAVIAAGGRARRLGTCYPKSLVTVGGLTLLEHCLAQLWRAGLKSALVYSNRTEWDSVLLSILARWRGTRLVRDNGVASTLVLAKDAAERHRDARICFMYGHAPRPSSHIRELIEKSFGLTTTLATSSSRIDKIKLIGGFGEPPFVVGASKLRLSSSLSWREFFLELSDVTNAVKSAGPPEANYLHEMECYRNYVHTFGAFKNRSLLEAWFN